MAVKFISKEDAKKISQKQHDAVTAIVDELHTNAADYAKAKKFVAQYDKVKGGLKGHIPEGATATEPVTFLGTEADAQFSAQPNQRKIENLQALHELVGDDVFYAIATIPLKEVDRYVTEPEQEGIVVKAATGARKFKLIPKD
jgi:hypothetical protein